MLVVVCWGATSCSMGWLLLYFLHASNYNPLLLLLLLLLLLPGHRLLPL
jgi:hypothetical protein